MVFCILSVRCFGLVGWLQLPALTLGCDLLFCSVFLLGSCFRVAL